MLPPPQGLQTCRCSLLPHCNASERPVDLSTPPSHTCSYFLSSLELGFSCDTTVHTLKELGWSLKGNLSEVWVCSLVRMDRSRLCRIKERRHIRHIQSGPSSSKSGPMAFEMLLSLQQREGQVDLNPGLWVFTSSDL